MDADRQPEKQPHQPRHLPLSRFATVGRVFLLAFLLLGLGATVMPSRQVGSSNSPEPTAPGLAHFGAEINRGSVARSAPLATAAGLTWVRYNGILWPEVETTQGERDWSVLQPVEQELRTLAEAGLTTVVVVRGAPTWAQQIPGVMCGPITPAALDTFASFLHDLVARYSVAPYNVRYWELGNEPDVAPAFVPETMPYGCWGDTNDPYYGGGYFAEMLKRAYPAIKQANPHAQVVLGGLALDCDPTLPPPGKDCTSSKFLEGILQQGGGQAFDILAYHSYAYWGGSGQDTDKTDAEWAHRGGALLGRLDFLRVIQQPYGINKPILVNEGGLLCWQSDPVCFQAGFLEAQASYLVRFYTRARANGITGAAWYTLNDSGWNESGLVGRGGAMRPSYYTLQFMANLLRTADYIGTISTGALEGYVLHSGTVRYQVYWTNDASRVAVPLPTFTRSVYNMYGHGITPSSGSVMVGNEPVFIEIKP